MQLDFRIPKPYLKRIPLIFIIEKPSEIDSSIVDKINNISVQIMDINFLISSIKKVIDLTIPDSTEESLKKGITEVKKTVEKGINEIKKTVLQKKPTKGDNKIFEKIKKNKEVTNKENIEKKKQSLEENKKLILKDKIILPMLVNPHLMEVNKNPKVTTTLTKKGLLAQYWPAEPDTLILRGDSANPKAFALLSQFDYLARTIETGTRNPVYMVYKFGLGVYRGFLKNFKVSLDATKPGWFAYQVDFTFLDYNHFRYFLYSVTPDFANQLINNPINAIRSQIEIGGREFLRNIPIGFK